MTLYFIGLGLADPEDISVKGLEIIRQCDTIYFEKYTSLLQCSIHDLEQFYGKKIIPATRELTETQDTRIVEEARTKKVAFLVVGDPFSATTHVELFKLAQEKRVPVEIIHNASILTAIAKSGLQLYKFGRTISLPFLEDHPHLESPYNMLRENKYLELHTLLLLDLQPEKNKFMTIPEAINILEKMEEHKKEHVVQKNMMALGCARLGSTTEMIKAAPIEKLKNIAFGSAPHCLIIPAKLHFMEEEMLQLWKA